MPLADQSPLPDPFNRPGHLSAPPPTPDSEELPIALGGTLRDLATSPHEHGHSTPYISESPLTPCLGASQSTAFYTARTTIPLTARTASCASTIYTTKEKSHPELQQLAFRPTASQTRRWGYGGTDDKDFEDDDDDNNDDIHGEKDDDKDQFDPSEFQHSPQFPPQQSTFKGPGGRSLRDTVFYRQNMRTFPPDDPLLERMENQLIRWTTPQSLFHVDEVLNGKHAYQKTELPFLSITLTLGPSTDSTQLTEPSVESIANSPFVSRHPSTSRAPPTASSMFIEDTREDLTAVIAAQFDALKSTWLPTHLPDIDETESSAPDLTLLRMGSPSVTDSLRLRLEETDDHTNDGVSREAICGTPRTSEAQLLTSAEIQLMIKEEPVAAPSMGLPSEYPGNILEVDDDLDDFFGIMYELLEICVSDTFFVLTCAHCACFEVDDVYEESHAANDTVRSLAHL